MLGTLPWSVIGRTGGAGRPSELGDSPHGSAFASVIAGGTGRPRRDDGACPRRLDDGGALGTSSSSARGSRRGRTVGSARCSPRGRAVSGLAEAGGASVERGGGGSEETSSCTIGAGSARGIEAMFGIEERDERGRGASVALACASAGSVVAGRFVLAGLADEGDEDDASRGARVVGGGASRARDPAVASPTT